MSPTALTAIDDDQDGTDLGKLDALFTKAIDDGVAEEGGAQSAPLATSAPAEAAGAAHPNDAPEGEPGAPAARADGRDERGRFAPKAEGEAAPAPPPEGAEPGAPKGPETLQSAPFQYRAVGQTHGVEGASLDAAGNLTVPAAHVPLIRAALNDHHMAQGEYRPVLERQSQELQALRTQVKGYQDREAVGDPVLNYFDQLMGLQDESQFIEQMFALRQNYPTLKAQAEVNFWKEQATRGAEATRPAPGRSDPAGATGHPAPAMPSAEEAWASTEDALESLRIEQHRGVADGDWQQIVAACKRTPFAFVRPATAEDAQHYAGVRAGEPVFDTDLVAHVVAERLAAARKGREDASRAAKMAADTARRTTPAVSAPPTAGGASAPPEGAGQRGRIQSKEEWDRYASDPDAI